MKNISNLFLLTILFINVVACRPKTDDKEIIYPDSAPSNLMIEFIRDPSSSLIMDCLPEYTWEVPTNIKEQRSYQIIVASSKELIDSDTGDIWDSGEVSSDLSAEVEHGGSRLMHNTIYYWKVRIWGDDDEPTSYSDAMRFTTGSSSEYASTANRFTFTYNKPTVIVKLSDHDYFVDFGRDAFGNIVLRYTPQEDGTLTIRLGEKVSQPYVIDRQPGGSIRYYETTLEVQKGVGEYTLFLPPDDKNTGPDAILLPDSIGVLTPFRYCEISNFNGTLNPDNIFQKAITYYFDDLSSSFTSDNDILNQVWDLCKYSIKATTFAGIYIDGDRERIPYEADAYINQLGHYYTDREYSMARRTNEYFIDHPTWPTEWILHTVLLFYNDYMFTGNKESISQFYSALKHKTLNSLSRQDGLISSKLITDRIKLDLGFKDKNVNFRDIVDWPPAQKDTGWKLATVEGERDGYELTDINTVVNAFYYRNLVVMAEIAQALGYKSDVEFYNAEASKVKEAINTKLFDSEKGVYVDGEYSKHSSIHSNMIPLAFNLVPEEHKSTVVSFIKSRGMACSVYGSQYLLEGLFRAGEYDYALSLMTATHDRSWWNMINVGSTISMEAWDMKYKPNSDWNHAWGAAPASIIPGFLWGIQPATPGFAKAMIKPQLGSLSRSEVTVPTIRGSIIAKYQHNDGKKEFFITIPGNMKCDFVIEKGSYRRITLNEKRLRSDELSDSQNGSDAIIQLSPGNNTLVIWDIE